MSHVVSIRLNEAAFLRYSELASGHPPRGLPLTTYLKQRLEEGDNVLDELFELRRQLEDLAERVAGISGKAAEGADAPTPADRGLALEAVLLLRTMSPANRLNSIHKEIQRQNLPVWTGED